MCIFIPSLTSTIQLYRFQGQVECKNSLAPMDSGHLILHGICFYTKDGRKYLRSCRFLPLLWECYPCVCYSVVDHVTTISPYHICPPIFTEAPHTGPPMVTERPLPITQFITNPSILEYIIAISPSQESQEDGFYRCNIKGTAI